MGSFPLCAQSNIDTALNYKLIQLYTWKVREIKQKGYLMFVDFPYNLGNPRRKPTQYINIWAGIGYNEKQPAYISFTLPDDVDTSKGLLIGFNNVDLHSSQFSLDKLKEVYKINIIKHWENNHTYVASLKDGMLIDAINQERIDIFDKFMHYPYLYVLFYDSLGLKHMYFPLSYFQQRYKEVSAPPPTYSTGNPTDTALTTEEMTDKKIFDDGGSGTIPTTWAMAGISDSIGLKHFFKYFRYLVNHNEKQKIAGLIEFPVSVGRPGYWTADDFVRNFDDIFNKKIRDQINKQQLSQIFRNIDGAMVSDCIWIRETRKNVFKIIAINCWEIK